MDIKDIKKIIEMLSSSDVSEFTLEQEKEGKTSRISVRRGQEEKIVTQIQEPQIIKEEPSPTTSVNPAPVQENNNQDFYKVESPIVGTFYRKPNPEADNYTQVGSEVKKGDKLCIIEAMKLMNEIESPVDGIVEKILVDDSSVVEYGEPLFLINTNA